MTLVAGSCDGVSGYNLDRHQSPALTPLFSFNPPSTINTLAVSGSRAASGSSDGAIKIYDLKSSTEIDSLSNLSSVTALSFSSPGNLISGDSEGSLSVYDESFALLKSVKSHANSINSLSVHPSGKLALSVGRDEFMSIVDLVQGKRRFYIRLFEEASIVQFDESGDKFFMVANELVGVHDSENAELNKALGFGKKERVLCLALGKNGILFTGGEDGNINAWDVDSRKPVYTIEKAHKEPIKGVAVLSQAGNGLSDMNPYTVASASVDGVICVWDMRMTNRNRKQIPLTETKNDKSNLTCLAGSSIPPCPSLEDDDNLDHSAAMIS